MYKLIAWIVWLLIMLIMAYKSSKGFLFTPQFGFIACFIPQAIYAIFYVDEWDLDFSPLTMIVLFGGTAYFLIISIFFQHFFSKIKRHEVISTYRSENKRNKDVDTERLNVKRWKIISMICLQLIILLMTMQYINIHSVGSNLSEKIANNYGTNLHNTSSFSLPLLLSWIKIFCDSSAYISVYLLLHSIICKYKVHSLLLLISISISVISLALGGGRFPIIALIIYAIIQAYFISTKYSRKKQRRINTKYILRGFCIVVLVIVLFQNMLGFVSRVSDADIGEYIAIYLSAQLKNLDIYVRKGQFGAPINKWQTLISLENFIGKYFGISSLLHDFDQPFNFYNGHALGNVYTVFYWYLYDGGLFGVFIFLTALAFLSQMFLSKAIYKQRSNGVIISQVIYSYLYYGIVTSFFCERYFISLISDTFLQMLISWWVITAFYTKIEVRIVKKPVGVKVVNTRITRANTQMNSLEK